MSNIDIDPEPAVMVTDTLRVHRRLDEAVIDILNSKNIPQDMMIPNLRQVFGTIAIIIAVIAHYYPIPFPFNRTLLFWCAISYFLISAVLQVATFYLDGPVLFVSHPLPSLGGARLRVETSLPRYVSKFTMKFSLVEPTGKVGAYVGVTRDTAVVESGIGRYFTQGGLLYAPRLIQDVEEMLQKVKISV
eukprot:PhF_6_TR8646/c0_g1_i2/m.13507/K12947/SPCS2, SPC2; signal peptidase complex subunit 2